MGALIMTHMRTTLKNNFDFFSLWGCVNRKASAPPSNSSTASISLEISNSMILLLVIEASPLDKNEKLQIMYGIKQIFAI